MSSCQLRARSRAYGCFAAMAIGFSPSTEGRMAMVREFLASVRSGELAATRTIPNTRRPPSPACT